MTWLDDLLGKKIQKNGAGVPDRKILNLIEGSGTQITVADNASTGATDVTIANTLVSVSHTGRTVVGRSAATNGVAADIGPASTNQVLRESGGSLGWGLLADVNLANNAITDAKLRTGTARSVIGRAGNTIGNVADISTSLNSGHVLRESGGTIAFGQFELGAFPTVTPNSVFGKGLGGGTAAQLTASTVGDVLRLSGGNLSFGKITAGHVAWEAGTSNAVAGEIGEFVQNTGNTVNLTTATTTNVCSISLTAGDWDVEGMVALTGTPGTFTLGAMNIVTTSAGSGTTVGHDRATTSVAPNATAASCMSITNTRFSLASTTTIYLTASATFSSSSCSSNGRIAARRAR